ncbi:hypothetical protein ACH5RR_013460 [Cinchona calisaya]|uniref:Uncharacterized protein n=1 Tax=Cinchona calisaya TaxID=153742 RepID=A0ABD3A0K6_9GENT
MTPKSQKEGMEAIGSFPIALLLIMNGLFFALMSMRRIRMIFGNCFLNFVESAIIQAAVEEGVLRFRDSGSYHKWGEVEMGIGKKGRGRTAAGSGGG